MNKDNNNSSSLLISTDYRDEITNIIRKASLWLFGVLCYYILFQSFYNIVAYRSIFPYSSIDLLLKAIWKNGMSILIMFGLNSIIILRRKWFVNPITLKMVIDVLLAALVMIIYNHILIKIFGITIDWGGTSFNCIFIMLALEVKYYVIHYKDSLQRVEAYRREMLQYQYDALKSQVNPHFLFNSLNILYSLIDLDTKKSKEFTMALSQIYRYIMSQQERTQVLLVEELEFLRSYTEVLSIRYNGSLTLEVIGEENAADHQVLTYCLQLAMENVTKHNVILPNKPMKVTINITDDGVTISNPIHPRLNSGPSSGKGLKYIHQVHVIENKKETFGPSPDNSTFCVHLPFVD